MRLVDNENFYNQLIRRRRDNSLCKTSLIIAPSGCGRGFAARILAAYYLCEDEKEIDSFALSPGSEVMVLTGEGASGEIKIAAVREIRAKAYETSLNGRGRVVIVKDANLLNRSSANALLKILEEPPKGLLFILTASSVGDLPATVVSRCTKYFISPVSAEATASYVSNLKLDEREKRLVISAFCGRLGAVKRFTAGKKHRNLLLRAGDVVDFALKGDSYGLLLALSGKGRDDRADIKELYYCIERLFIAVGEGRYGTATRSDIAGFTAAVAVGKAGSLIKRNLNQKLITISLCEEITEAFNE